jgi:DNA-binding MarR family transcriptional regulator
LSLQPSAYANSVEGTTFSCDDVLVQTPWLSARESEAWVGLAAVLELLPGVLDSQLRRDAELTHFDYYVLAMLSEAPRRTLRMTALAAQTSATLPRLSHVAQRLEGRGLIERFPCPQDARATNVRLTADGWRKVRKSAPGHVANVREHVIDALTAEQLDQLADITRAVLLRLDPEAAVASPYREPASRPAKPSMGNDASDR